MNIHLLSLGRLPAVTTVLMKTFNCCHFPLINTEQFPEQIPISEAVLIPCGHRPSQPPPPPLSLFDVKGVKSIWNLLLLSLLNIFTKARSQQMTSCMSQLHVAWAYKQDALIATDTCLSCMSSGRTGDAIIAPEQPSRAYDSIRPGLLRAKAPNETHQLLTADHVARGYQELRTESRL